MGWWSWIQFPVWFLVVISGFVIYRYRETRAMTLAQFFEIRYSRSFRVFTGILGFGAGIVNFGIIPVVGARFIAYFLGFPATARAKGRSIGKRFGAQSPESRRAGRDRKRIHSLAAIKNTSGSFHLT